MKELIKNAIILCLITVVAGLLLGFVYEFTKERREEEENKAIQESYKAVFEDAQSFKAYNYEEALLTEYIDAHGISEKEAVINEIMTAYDEYDQIMGYAVMLTSKEGYGGDIKFVIGIRLDGNINGISILSISETAGLGMNATEEAFLKEFRNKNVSEFVVSKTASTVDTDVDAISGATITSTAIVKGANAGILAFDYALVNKVITDETSSTQQATSNNDTTTGGETNE